MKNKTFVPPCIKNRYFNCSASSGGADSRGIWNCAEEPEKYCVYYPKLTLEQKQDIAETKFPYSGSVV